ncbi:LIC10816 family protein [Leptospira sp. 'Mane']|uniref:LIC10816 family protein n=1 Tax=Leptospira sp. 'Mane' TaxID=3387407 RepID=UPI00398B276B
MNAITIFALALLAVPVFARFAKVSKEAIVHYHLIGLGGLFMLVGEATRITADKIAPIAFLLPAIDVVTAVLAYAGVVFGTVWLALHYIKHPREI